MTAVAVQAPAHARHAPPEPQQLGFLDEPAEPPHLRVAVMGVVERQAEVRISSDGRVHLVVQVIQPKGGPPFVAMHHEPGDARPQLEHLAARLTPGTAVLLRGAGLTLAHHHGVDALQLVRCDSVNEIEFPTLTTTAAAPATPEHHA